jgi:hypothetical protein
VKVVATPRHPAAVASGNAVRFLEDVLDELQITDREYHHLNLSIPLSASIVDSALRTVRSGERVLLVGGTTLLARALMRLDVDLEIWRFPQSHLVAGTESRVTSDVTPHSLADMDIQAGNYSLVILPFVVESVSSDVANFLRRMRASLAPGGRIVIATRNQARMGTRIAAMLGRPFATKSPAGPFSLSWPNLPIYREYHGSELIAATRRAGLQAEQCQYIDASRLFLELEPMPIEAYVAKKVAGAVRRLAPSMRDTLLLELSSRPGDDGPLPATPDVSVVLGAVSGGNALRNVLNALKEQTYPADRYEIVVLHDGREDVRTVVAEALANSPVAVRELVGDAVDGAPDRNRALQDVRAPIVGHTDDSALLPRDWIEAAVMRFDDDTAVVSGPVFAGPDSHPKYFDVPGTRPDPAERERWRIDLFPIVNVFYRTSAVRAGGGFNPRVGTVAWPPDLAWRMERAGWRSRFCETLSIASVFRGPERFSPLDEVRRASDLPRLYARVPELRTELVGGLFASRQTMYADVLLAGAALAVSRRNPKWLVAAVPWLAQVSRRFGLWPPRKWIPSSRVITKMGVLHILWLAGLVVGSIRVRKVIL